MKKLMIMAAVVVATVAVKAANVDWSVDLSGTTEAGTAWDYWDNKTFYTINGAAATYVEMLTSGNVEGFNTAMSSLVSSGMAKQNTFAEWSFSVASGLNENAADYLTVIALGEGLDPDDKFYYSEKSTAGMTYSGGEKSPGTLEFTAANFSSDVVGNVPEPTSGLLLLLGVAGLALRRRRA